MKRFTKAVTFSYDDGCVQDRKLIEIFNRYGIKGTFNICTGNAKAAVEEGWKTENGVWVRRNDFSKEENVRLYDGHEVAAHTKNHLWLTKVNTEVVKSEIFENKEDLEGIFGSDVIGMAYPFNTYDDRTVKILKEGNFLYARGGDTNRSFDLQTDLLRFRPTCHHNDDALFDIAEEFVNMECRDLKIFYVWGHAYEFENDDNWDRIESLCKMLSGRDDIFFGSNREVFEFQKTVEDR